MLKLPRERPRKSENRKSETAKYCFLFLLIKYAKYCIKYITCLHLNISVQKSYTILRGVPRVALQSIKNMTYETS